jgi:hypothetical protein
MPRAIQAAQFWTAWRARSAQKARSALSAVEPGHNLILNAACSLVTGPQPNSSICALTVSGKVFCYGGNDFGTVGDGTQTYHTNPV